MEESIQVKDEPLDPEYDNALNSTENGETEPPGTDQHGEDFSQKIKSILNNMITGDSKLTVNSVIDNLLKQNDEILEQADTTIYKPRGRIGWEKYLSKDSGSLLRPKSPTQTCSIPKEDMPNLSDTLVELSVCDANAEEIFEKMKQEVVCAVVSKAFPMSSANGNNYVPNNLKFYWCNFCPFKNEDKEVLLHHVMDHRFHCKFCPYQTFSRADVISHEDRTHKDFKDTAKTLKYCIFQPDYIALQSNDRKRPMEDKSEPVPKKSKKDKKSTEKDEEYDAFDMEVEEVDDENNYTPSNSETTDKILTPSNAKKNLSVVGKVTKSRPSNQNKPTEKQPTTNNTSTSSNNPPPIATANMQSTTTGKSGNTITVSSGLCWNCGYCDFVTLSQTFLKTHLNTQHNGKAHKYVAMLVSSQEEMNKIKERDAKMYSTSNLALLYGNVNQTQEKTLSPPADGSGLPSSTKKYDSATSTVVREDGPEDDSDDEEYIPEEEKKKYPLTYKCAHCNFNAPVCFKIKEHLQMKHPGCVLYALDMRAVKLKQRRYVFFCHRKNCSFTTKKTEEYLSHSENCTPWLLENCPESVELATKKCLELTRNFSTKISQKAFQMAKNFKASKSAEYACTHCSYTSNNNTRVKKHVLSNHRDLKTVMKDLQSHKMKKKTHVFFCRHCLWETRNEEELTGHLEDKHKDEEELANQSTSSVPASTPPVVETVERKTSKQVALEAETENNATEDATAEEEDIDLDLEVSEEEMQKMMTEFVKDEACRSGSPGRPTRKASIEASVRVRAQGHQPPMYRCMHCYHMCFGSNLMKKHIRINHKKEALRTVDVKKRISRQFAYYCICPHDNCKFVNTSEETVLNHAIQEHKIKKDNPEIQRMLLPFTPQITSTAEPQASSTTKGNTPSTASSVSSVSSPTVGYECLYCSTSFVTQNMELMKRHIRREHPGEDVIFRDCVARKMRKSSRIYMCERDYCGFYNCEQKELELHKLAHEKAHIFECVKCQWFTTTTETVHSHMATVHHGEEVKTIDMSLDLDGQGQVIKRVGGMVIKQECPVEDENLEDNQEEAILHNDIANLSNVVIKQEPVDL
ncbi:zinc finger protein 423-like [Saccostrea echinata]|uniref:zinc finger protein 423-like n=1 Tax=Saccostrea echinata TaxID=191078 RepID=UPI002A83122F|nr:zinc finger protein 423-like [Saccostrea echinata]